ncbi:hypothetical protein EJB05_02602, partial [Eragrostis curvula]
MANATEELAHTSYLKKGASLSVDRASDILLSPDGTFSFGFYNLSSTTFSLSVWFTNSADRAIAWSANRNRPVYGSRSKVMLKKDGALVLTDYDGTIFIASDNTSFVSADWGPGIKRRLTLDYDGYVFRDPSDWSKGCKPTFDISCRGGPKMGFVPLPHSDFWGSDLDYVPSTSLDVCRARCLARCSCLAFEYKSDNNGCFLKSVLLNGKTVPGYPGTAYLKVPESFLSEIISSDSRHIEVLDCNVSSIQEKVLAFASDVNRNGGSATVWSYYYGFLAAFFFIELCFIAFGWWFMARRHSVQSEIWATEEVRIPNHTSYLRVALLPLHGSQSKVILDKDGSMVLTD